MATLQYDEIRPRKFIIYNNEPYEVLESHVARTQQRKPQNQVKMRNLLNGKVIPGTFHAADKAEEADIYKRDAKFLYTSKGEYWFRDPKDGSKRFQISSEKLGERAQYLKGETIVSLNIFENDDEEEEIIGVTLPIKMSFVVKEAPPSTRGNTSSGGDKRVTLETGAQITTPLFIEQGETIIVNTDTGQYVERVK